MGMKTFIPGTNSFNNRERDHASSSAAIHRARVSEVHVDKGTVSLSFESISYTAEACIPLLGLSAPLDSSEKANYLSSSWGRYMPQVGDILLVGFGTNRKVHVLGYSSIYYKGFGIKDVEFEDSGGIGWGSVSGKSMKPGDWDFRSSRYSGLYMGDRAKIYSGNCGTTYNYNTNDIISTSLLMVNEAGPSDVRYGAVRRRVLPTDPSESYVPSVRAGTNCQEFTASTKWNPGTGPIDLAVYSQGDVVETVSDVSSIKMSSAGLPVRRWAYSTDITGLITTYDEYVDSNGNVSVTAATSTSWSYNTPLSAWEVQNLSTDLTSSLSISLSAGVNVDVISTMVNLGASIGGLPLVKATPVLTVLWSTYFAAASAAWSVLAANVTVSPDSNTSAIFTAAATQATAMAAALTPTTKVKAV